MPDDQSKPAALAPNERTFVNCASRRARHRLAGVLGYKPIAYYKSFTSDAAGPHYAYYIRAEDLAKARRIKGVTRRRDCRDLHVCWDEPRRALTPPPVGVRFDDAPDKDEG